MCTEASSDFASSPDSSAISLAIVSFGSESETVLVGSTNADDAAANNELFQLIGKYFALVFINAQ